MPSILRCSTQVREAIAAHRPGLLINASAFNDVDGAESRIGGSLRGERTRSAQPRRRNRRASKYRYFTSQPIMSSMAPAGILITNSTAPIRFRFMAPASSQAKTPSVP